ncbi:MAG: hypothetical protein KA198_05185 [Chitinophagaceae bacterium]|nr:hypothetical protein [Chitinophagaceae bacterium]
MKKWGFYLLLFTFIVNNCFAQCWETISAGGSHTIGLKPNHTIWAWGDNYYGQLGDGSNISKISPVPVGTDSTWKGLSAGSSHCAAIRLDGSLWAWGFNAQGALGDGTLINRNTPTLIGSDTNWKVVSCGNGFTLALKTDGTLWSWGANYYGQIGNGNTTQTNTPIQVGSSNDWNKIFAGDDHSFAIKNNGTLWGWGWNPSGGLGDGTNVNKYAPTQIGVDSNWLVIGPGFKFTTAVKTNGTLWAWGINSSGQLGNFQFAESFVPINISADSAWTSCSSGYHHSLATKSPGSLWSWGGNNSGQLGNMSSANVNHPIQIGTDTTWSFVHGSKGTHSAGLKTTGTLNTWGENAFGQLGNGGSGNYISSPLMIACPVIPQIPLLNQIPSMLCENGSAQVGKCLNPIGNVDITLDGNPIFYNVLDSTFVYGPSFVGAHLLHVSYSNGAGMAYLDTVYTTLAAPIISISSIPTLPILCVGQSITLNALGGTSVLWSNGISNNISITPTTSSTYTATVTDALGCSNSDTIFVEVNSWITPNLSVSSSLLQGSTGNPIIYTANTNVSAPYTIKWYLNNSYQTSTSTASWNTQIVAGNNQVKAVLTSPTQCLQPDSAVSNTLDITNVTGLTFSQELGLHVYPNPFQEFIQVDCIEASDQIILMNSFGQIILKLTGEKVLQQKNKIATNQLARGIYRLLISRKQEQASFTLIK